MKQLELHHISTRYGAGRHGLASHASFDAIIVTSASLEITQALMEQLDDGNILVLPLEK